MKLLMLIFLFFVVFQLQGSESFEISATMHGIHQWNGLFLYSGRKISGALTFKVAKDNNPTFMFGFNTAFLAAGRLGDMGLAAEVRNPAYDSSLRSVEKTRYRANLRSYSNSRIGIALMLLDSRMGLALERRKDVDAGIIWVVPILTDSWNFEVLGTAAMLRSAISDDYWYPRRLQRAESPLGIVSSRLRYSFSKSDMGMTFIVSGGTHLRVGYLAGWSFSTSSGPWGLFFRSIYSSSYFHNAEGKRLDIPVGGKFVLQFKPRKGFQFRMDYKAGLERAFHNPWRFTDKGGIGLGWNFSELRILLSSDWNYAFSKEYEEALIREIKLKIGWDRKLHSLALSSAVKTNGGWYAKIEGGVPITDLWQLDAFIKLHETANSLLLDFKIKGSWNIGDNRFIMLINMRDLVRDWHRGPSTAGDLEVNLRWIRKLGKDE